MEKRTIGLFAVVLFALVVLPLVSADDTVINVQTFAGHTGVINVLDTTTLDALRTFEANATEAGMMSVTFSSGSRQINISILIRSQEGKIVRKMEYGPYATGSPLSFDLRTDPNAPKPAPVVTPPVVVTPPAPVVQNVTNKTSVSKITGSATNNSSSFSFKLPSWNADYTKYAYYALYGIVAIVVIWLLIKFAPGIFSKMRGIRAPAGPVIAGKSTADNYRYNTKMNKELEDAERKIKEAQAEIARIRNRGSRVSEAEKKFEEAKRELERARREGI